MNAAGAGTGQVLRFIFMGDSQKHAAIGRLFMEQDQVGVMDSHI